MMYGLVVWAIFMQKHKHYANILGFFFSLKCFIISIELKEKTICVAVFYNYMLCNGVQNQNLVHETMIKKHVSE